MQLVQIIPKQSMPAQNFKDQIDNTGCGKSRKERSLFFIIRNYRFYSTELLSRTNFISLISRTKCF